MAFINHFRAIFFVAHKSFLIYTYRSHISEKSLFGHGKAPFPTGIGAFESSKKTGVVLQSVYEDA